MLTGERIVGAMFGLLGLLWIVKSFELHYMDEFAPGSGFLPFWLGVAIAAFAAMFLYSTRGEPAATADPSPPGGARKVAVIALGLFVCVVAMEWLGFVVPIALYLLFLVGVVERRGVAVAAGTALGTPLALFLIFKVFLRVPLPIGPWGF
ncbi:MAG: tripartite tricarboxylate transporter TctB family protein [Pseudomonadota bacterium]